MPRVFRVYVCVNVHTNAPQSFLLHPNKKENGLDGMIAASASLAPCIFRVYSKVAMKL